MAAPVCRYRLFMELPRRRRSVGLPVCRYKLCMEFAASGSVTPRGSVPGGWAEPGRGKGDQSADMQNIENKVPV